MSERYRFLSRDAELLLSVTVLLRKLAVSGTIRPAQLVTVAKLLHVLSVLPCVTEDVTASVSLCGPRHKFGEIETFHWWDFSIEDRRLSISSGGHFHDPSSGGDTFTTMDWSAVPEEPTELNDYRDTLWMVPDVQSYSDGVGAIDLSEESYTAEILDDNNPLLEEHGDTEEDVENNDELEGGEEDAACAEDVELALQPVSFPPEAELSISVELYRPNEMIEVSQKEWQMALLIFRENGWNPALALGRLSCPLAFVTQDEGKAMQCAGRSLFNLIDGEPVVATSIQMDIGLLYRLTDFVGGGAFIVGRPGSYENAQANDF